MWTVVRTHTHPYTVKTSGVVRMKKTIINGKKCEVNTDGLSTTEEVDKIIEEKIGRKLGVVKIDDHGLIE